MTKIIVTGGWISHPAWKDISCIQENGKLDEGKFSDICREVTGSGGTHIGVFPAFFPDAKHMDPMPTDRANYAPWVFEGGGYNLYRPNSQYLHNLEKIKIKAKLHGLGILYKLFDRCHFAAKIERIRSPFNCNTNGIRSMSDLFARDETIMKGFIDNVLAVLGKDAIYELCNEPRHLPDIGIKKIWEHIRSCGVDPKNIISGFELFCGEDDWHKKYENTSRLLRKSQYKYDDRYDHGGAYASIHQWTRADIGHLPNHSRKILFSDDGAPMPEHVLYGMTKGLWEGTRKKAKHLRFVQSCAWEHLYDGREPIDAVKGYYDALKEIGVPVRELPKKSTEVIPPPVIPEKPKPEKEKDMTRPRPHKIKKKFSPQFRVAAILAGLAIATGISGAIFGPGVFWGIAGGFILVSLGVVAYRWRRK